MHVIAHQAVQVKPHPVLPRLFAQLLQKPPPVSIVAKNLLPPIPSNGDVVDGPLEHDSQFPPHPRVLTNFSVILQRSNLSFEGLTPEPHAGCQGSRWQVLR